MPFVVGFNWKRFLSRMRTAANVYTTDTMTTHFITAEIDLSAAELPLVEEVNAELAKHGEPLRWAIAAVDEEKQTAQVEAVVTKRTPTLQVV
jgi:hypothetical protein